MAYLIIHRDSEIIYKQLWCCHMDPALLLLQRCLFLSRTASLSSHIQVVTLLPPSPSPIHVFSLSSGWVCAGLLQTRALCHPAPSHNHPHHLSPLSLSAYFPLFSPSCAVLCDLLKPGRHVITLLDTKNSRQPVFSEEKEENEQGKQSDTSSRLLGHSV